MIHIHVRTIPHGEQRYNTVGDYSSEDGVRKVLVSDISNTDMEFLVALHELIEQHLCEQAEVTDKEIDEFDVQFEAQRQAGDTREPGDDKAAPYYWQHQFATAIERLVAVEIGVDWGEYTKVVEGVS